MINYPKTTLPNVVRNELELARLIQQSTYPARIPAVEGYAVLGDTQPASWSNGDFYDAVGLMARQGQPGFVLDRRESVENLLLVLGDATGHGTGPALIATELRAIIRASIRLGVSHRNLTRCMNDQLCEDLPDGHFITLLMGRLNLERHMFRWVSFGQAPLFFYSARNHQVQMLEAHQPPLGLLPSAADYTPTETFFEPGDAFLVLSDGYMETANAHQELWGAERAAEVLRTQASHGPAAVLQALLREVNAFAAGQPQQDDRTFLMILRQSD